MGTHLLHPVFDGHNDALTRGGAPDLARRLADGHLDLPRMREGGVRGGIFAVFTPSPNEKPGQVRFSDGVTAAALAPPVSQEEAATHAAAAAERLLALEQAGELVVASTIEDVDAARDGTSPPSTLRALRRSTRASRRSASGTRGDCARSGPSGAEPTPSRPASSSPFPPPRTSAPA